MRKKTSTGVAERIEVSTEERCGGAAVRGEKTNLAASSRSMRAKTMRMRRMRLESSKQRENTSST
jgi:hypothetical protein